MAAELEKRKLIKAQEFGYDSTWSEVEQILDEQYKSQYIRPCMLQNRSFNQFKKINLYKKIQVRYGVIGLLIIHNMLSDPNISDHLVQDGMEMKFCLEQLEEDKVMQAFNIMLHNILICFRSFMNFQDCDVKSENNEYWLSQGSKKLAKST